MDKKIYPKMGGDYKMITLVDGLISQHIIVNCVIQFQTKGDIGAVI